jgi:hypothetical protein
MMDITIWATFKRQKEKHISFRTVYNATSQKVVGLRPDEVIEFF